MYKKHRDVLELDDNEESLDVDASNMDCTLQSEVTDNIDITDDTQSNPKKTAALFLLKATTMCKLSKTALDQLIGDVSLFLSDKIQSLEKDVRAALHARNLELDEEFASVFQAPSVTCPFQGLHSEFLRRKFYINDMGEYCITHTIYMYAYTSSIYHMCDIGTY